MQGVSQSWPGSPRAPAWSLAGSVVDEALLRVGRTGHWAVSDGDVGACLMPFHVDAPLGTGLFCRLITQKGALGSQSGSVARTPRSGPNCPFRR